MQDTNTHQAEMTYLPILSSQGLGWENILVNQFQPPSGEALCQFDQEHAICLSLSPRPVQFLHVKGGKTYTGVYGKGDISITPAEVPLFARWESADHFLEIRLASQFIQTVARETIRQDADRIELLPEFRTRDPQLESIAQLLLPELKSENLGGRLYVESLTNILAVHLIRQYTGIKPYPLMYEGGLPQRQLLHVLEYIDAYLDQEIKLADLAQLLDMSQFHFSRLFKQSIGMAPYQYLLQQRIERAKQLLQQSDRSILEIALICGFNSHSHLSKQFRQLTGMTPTAYKSLR